jgi:8-oxo-dGTP diphosphatase
MSNNEIYSERTICFPIKNDEILLGMKLKGFGSGKYNGFGGKLHTDETKKAAARRELEEESGLMVSESDLEECAVIDFEFPFRHEFDQRVHVYFTSKWKGTPKKTEEMDPEWFDIDDVPYGKMWDSDKLWLPVLLEGKKFRAKFTWKEDNETVDEYSIDFVNLLK